MDKTLIFNFAAAMLAIVNPLGNLPLFISYTAGEKKLVRNWLAVFIAITIAGLLAVFLILGTQLLNFFGITLAAFRISGSILLLLTGIKMVEGKQTKNTRKLAAQIDRNDLQEAKFV